MGVTCPGQCICFLIGFRFRLSLDEIHFLGSGYYLRVVGRCKSENGTHSKFAPPSSEADPENLDRGARGRVVVGAKQIGGNICTLQMSVH